MSRSRGVVDDVRKIDHDKRLAWTRREPQHANLRRAAPPDKCRSLEPLRNFASLIHHAAALCRHLNRVARERYRASREQDTNVIRPRSLPDQVRVERFCGAIAMGAPTGGMGHSQHARFDSAGIRRAPRRGAERRSPRAVRESQRLRTRSTLGRFQGHRQPDRSPCSLPPGRWLSPLRSGDWRRRDRR